MNSLSVQPVYSEADSNHVDQTYGHDAHERLVEEAEGIKSLA